MNAILFTRVKVLTQQVGLKKWLFVMSLTLNLADSFANSLRDPQSELREGQTG